MGMYLMLIAAMDVHSMGIYFNYAIDWQEGKWIYVLFNIIIYLTVDCLITFLCIIVCEYKKGFLKQNLGAFYN